MTSLIAVISDFGLKDHYAGTIHGVINQIAPETKVVDITHSVRPFDVVDGALKLKWSYRYFPSGTIFLCLVDPDPSAIPIIVTTENYFLVCPNNGIGSLMFEEEPPEAAHRITAEHYFINRGKSGNFRSRDQLAPIAAELSRLQTASHLGEEIDLKQIKRFRLPHPSAFKLLKTYENLSPQECSGGYNNGFCSIPCPKVGYNSLNFSVFNNYVVNYLLNYLKVVCVLNYLSHSLSVGLFIGLGAGSSNGRPLLSV